MLLRPPIVPGLSLGTPVLSYIYKPWLFPMALPSLKVIIIWVSLKLENLAVSTTYILAYEGMEIQL